MPRDQHRTYSFGKNVARRLTSSARTAVFLHFKEGRVSSSRFRPEGGCCLQRAGSRSCSTRAIPASQYKWLSQLYKLAGGYKPRLVGLQFTYQRGMMNHKDFSNWSAMLMTTWQVAWLPITKLWLRAVGRDTWNVLCNHRGRKHILVIWTGSKLELLVKHFMRYIITLKIIVSKPIFLFRGLILCLVLGRFSLIQIKNLTVFFGSMSMFCNQAMQRTNPHPGV